MANGIWFNLGNSDLHIMHRKAYEKSLKCNHAVKVVSGSYYYKGFEIEKSGGDKYPWNYRHPSETECESVQTKADAMMCIDEILKDEIDLCDIMCR